MRRFLAALSLLVSTSVFAAVPTSQRDALISLYNATGGPATWIDRTNWLGAPGSECTWYGVVCESNDTTVAALILNENGLTGALPSSIGSFPDLHTLFLFDNPMSGPIPPAIGQLTEMVSMVLDRSGFTGPIPSSIGNLVKMTFFNADGNLITGPLPRELGNLRALEEIDLSFNPIDGPLPPELGQLSNLRALDINVTELSGPIPPQLGNLSKLESLTLTENNLTGTIPASLGSLPALHTLRLSNNELTGPIPTALANLPSLVTLDLNNNRLSGTIPRELGDMNQLKNLYLAVNDLEGTIPVDLFDIDALEELDLGVNRLTGSIPREIGQVRSLRKLSLNSNQLTGPIPTEIGLLSNLESFELLNNQLSGSVPRELTQLTKLAYLDIAGNDFTGPLPSGFGALKQLFFFSVYENQLSGPIPADLGDLPELTVLFLTSNQFSGAIPDNLRNLRKLEVFYVAGNRLTGPFPEWIGELTALRDVFFAGNELTGSLPPSLGNLVNLETFYVDFNLLSGTIPREVGNLKQLRYFSAEFNDIGGPIPPELWTLTQMIELRFSENHFTGTLPPEIGNLVNLQTLLLQDSDLEGVLPPEIGNMRSLLYLDLGANFFTGPLPRELGNLENLLNIDLSTNAFRGAIPSELTGMTSLEPLGSDFAYNLLFTNDATLRAFLNSKQFDGDFERSQTLPPSNVRVTAVTDRNATIEWDLIRFFEGQGGYQVVASETAGGPPVVIATTASKEIGSIVVRNLEAQKTYFFTVVTVSHPDELQKNLLISDATPPVSATTTQKVFAPPDIAVTVFPAGLVQIDMVPANEDSFTLTNFGDQSTDVTLFKEGDFYTAEPLSFTLAGGASQVVRLRSVPQPPGTYYGYLAPDAVGVGEDVYVSPTLLSVVRPAGTVIAEPVSTRVDIAGAPGSDSVGQARFRNRGTAALTGLLISDQPWVVPNTDTIRIDPGQTATVNFRVVRARRPPEAEGNALTGNLMLVYVDGSIGQLLKTLPLQTVLQAPPSSGINVTLVTVVDQPRPPVSPLQAPQIGAGELALFAPGVVSLVRDAGRFVSDVSILNIGSARSINDLRLFFTPAGTSQSSVASLGNVDVTKAVTLSNVVSNIYGTDSGTGSLQLRSSSAQSLSALAKVVAISGLGTMTGDIPLFRSDRSIIAGQQLLLPGVRKSSTLHTDLYVQETAGQAATARIEYLNASGGSTRELNEVTLAPFAMIELADAVPSGAVTVVITNVQGSTGRISAYGRITDDTSGDTWSIVDWSRLNRFPATEAVRVPFADRTSGAPPPPPPPGRRRRAVGRDEVAGEATTELTLFNPATESVRVTVDQRDANGGSSPHDLTLGPRQTVVTTINAPAVQAVVEPSRGQIAVTARTFRSGTGTFGTNVPVVDARSGLRVGQSQRFPNLDDSTMATVTAAKPGTFRTAFGFVETSGSPVTVRARMNLDQGRSLVTQVIFRDFQLGANQQLVFDNMVRSIVGASRETALGELHNLQLSIEVTGGSGSVVPFIVVTDNGTGDSLLRLE